MVPVGKGGETICRSVVDALADHVTERPASTAIEWGPRSLSYAELWERSGAGASTLVEQGLAPGALVALTVADPLERIVAMLAVVRAGGSYLALEPSLPAARVELLLTDCRPAFVLDEVPPQGTPADLPRTDGDDLFCVFYTSGTTGRPKGVPLRHRGVVRLFGGEEPMRLEAGARMSHVSSVMFDATTLEIWGPLLQGGTVVCLDRETFLETSTVAETIARERLTAMFMTTALFRAVARRHPGAFAALDALFVGGEALDGASARAVLEADAPRRFYNLYGPTETTTLATFFPIHERGFSGDHVPIGRAVPKTTVALLDEDLSPVPSGELGEVCVAGDGLAVGYLGLPGLTAARFVPTAEGRRFYRTGDLARSVGGDLVFAGRRDRQVKISGFRIELEEVEVSLATHESVVAAAAWVEEGRLVASVATDGALEEEAFRGWLRERVPSYLIPSRIDFDGTLGLTENGKLDRSALEPSGGAYEDVVAEVWASVLGVPAVPHDRNFFDLGGESLLLLDVQIELEERLGSAPDVGELLAAPTVRDQARLLRGGAATVADVEEVAAGDGRSRLARRRELLLEEGPA